MRTSLLSLLIPALLDVGTFESCKLSVSQQPLRKISTGSHFFFVNPIPFTKTHTERRRACEKRWMIASSVPFGFNPNERSYDVGPLPPFNPRPERKSQEQLFRLPTLQDKAERQKEEHEKIMLGKRASVYPDPKKLWKLMPEKITKHYEVVSELGRGGYGCVVCAEAKVIMPNMPQRVAIKLCRPQPGEIPLMLKEGIAMQRVKSPLIAKCYDIGCETRDGGLVWFCMELLQGRTLNDILVDRGPLSIREACSVGIDVLDGLIEVHGAGLLHRDIKPHNIMRVKADDGRWRYKLIDFGTATGALGHDRMALPTVTRQNIAQITNKCDIPKALSSIFADLDRGDDGLLGTEDVMECIRGFGMRANAEQAREILGRHDGDKSGFVDSSEFPSMYAELSSLPLSAMAMQPEHLSTLRDVFASIDADKNGYINLTELELCFRVLNRQPSRERLQRLLARYDADGDGLCDAGEFVGMYGELAALQDSMNWSGTHGYIAPEVYNDAALSPASDLWSLAATLFRLTAGQLPFTVMGGTWGKGFVGDLSLQAPDLRSLCPAADARFATALARGLRKIAAERFRTAAEMKDELLHVLAAL